MIGQRGVEFSDVTEASETADDVAAQEIPDIGRRECSSIGGDMGSRLWQWNPSQEAVPDFLGMPSSSVDTGNFDNPLEPQFENFDTGLFGERVEPNFELSSDIEANRSDCLSGYIDQDGEMVDHGLASRPDTSVVQLESSNDLQSKPTVSTVVHHATFSRNLLSNCDATGIKLPWETEFYNYLFGEDSSLEDLVPKMPVSGALNLSAEADPQQIADGLADIADVAESQPVFASHISCVDDVNFLERRENLIVAAIWKLLLVIRHCLSASSTGRHILELGADAAQSQDAVDVVSAVVGVKSPATLVKRANALLSFLRWVDKTCQHVENAFEEPIVWKKLCHLKEDHAPATRGATMMSALRFARFVLGFECLEAVINSRRLQGICDIMMASKRLLRQSLVLTVTQVLGLHGALRNPNLHCMDKAVVAYLLIALYGRCRHSDLQFISSLECDYNLEGGYMLIQTCCHKTGRMAALKSRLLPIMIPARGVDGTLWAEDAMKALFGAGVDLTAPVNGPLLKAPAGGFGTFMSRGLKSNEVSSLLRQFLGAPEPVPGQTDPCISSHSLKATVLSWCARFGLSPSTRSLLGRHVSSLHETFAIYSRDLACAPVAELQKVIDEIHAGRFSPDSQRSEFFKGSQQVVAVSESDPPDPAAELSTERSWSHVDQPAQDGATNSNAEEEAHDIDASSDSSSCSETQSSNDSDTEVPVPKVKRFRPRIPAEEEWFVHAKSHLVHRLDVCDQAGSDMRFLACGKRLTPAYRKCTEADAWNTLCKSCNKR